MLSTLQLTSILIKDREFAPYFGGVCAANEIHSKISMNKKIYIVNTQNSYQNGKHWVAFLINFGKFSEFFDSLGESPQRNNPLFEIFLKKQKKKYKINLKRFQNFNTDSCGKFCLFFLKLRIWGYSMEDICNYLSNYSLHENELQISKFVSDQFEVV